MPFDALPYCRIEVRDRISAMKAVFVLAAAGLAFVPPTSVDRDGHVVYSTSNLISVHARIYAALFRPDGCVWLVSGGPHGLSDDFAMVSDLGSALPSTGEHLEALR